KAVGQALRGLGSIRLVFAMSAFLHFVGIRAPRELVRRFLVVPKGEAMHVLKGFKKALGSMMNGVNSRKRRGGATSLILLQMIALTV
nr:capsid [Kampung Karu virus]